MCLYIKPTNALSKKMLSKHCYNDKGVELNLAGIGHYIRQFVYSFKINKNVKKIKGKHGAQNSYQILKGKIVTITFNRNSFPMLITSFTGFIQTSMSKFQGLLKASPTVFKDLKLMNNTDRSVKIILQKC